MASINNLNEFKPRTKGEIIFHITFTIFFILLLLFGIGYCSVKFHQYLENDFKETREYVENNPNVTFIDANTIEISFSSLVRPESRANYLRVHNYEIVSASKDRFGATMYIVKVKRDVE